MDAKHYGMQIFLGLLALAALLVIFIFLPELNVVVLAITFTILAEPWYVRLTKLMPQRKDLAALVIVIAIIALVIAPLTFFGFQIFQEAQGLYARLAAGGMPPALSALASSLNLNLNQYLEQVLGGVVANLGALFSGLVSIFATFFLAFFGTYYFLHDGEKLKQMVIKMMPLPEKNTEEIIEKLRGTASSVIRGSLLVAIVYGLLVGLGFFIFGLTGPVLWGAVAVVASFIPVFGVMLIMIPGICFLAFSGNLPGAIGLTAWTLFMSGSVESLLRPWLIGRSSKIHPALLLLSILGGLQFFGPIGILLGPLALGFFLTLLETYPLLAAERNAARKRMQSA